MKKIFVPIASLFITVAAGLLFQVSTAHAGTSITMAVTVLSGPATPTVTSFTANPAVIATGSSLLSWSATNASTVAITPGGFSTSTLSGSLSVSPTSTTVYTLTASNGSASTTATTSVTLDTTPPSVPTSVVATAASASEIDLTWATSTDTNGISGYQVFQGLSTSTLAQIATATQPSYANTGLAAATAYYYAVTAVDLANNTSSPSNAASATTPAQPTSGGGGGGGGGGGSYYTPVPTVATTTLNLPTSTEALQALLTQLTTQLEALLVQAGGGTSGGGTTATGTPSFYFARNLAIGMAGYDVQNLQIYLNRHGYPVAAFGFGSSGNEVIYFGAKTQAALIMFQQAHGIRATGFFGPITRSYMNSHS
ncbi:MAG TPA: peptidoglycan-binding domain-containing protein [Candidatus Paceibacterota bacterium]|nr:peptidoglycan-binding domain-containing protein [Candidatus Paceibacterota bacterium]